MSSAGAALTRIMCRQNPCSSTYSDHMSTLATYRLLPPTQEEAVIQKIIQLGVQQFKVRRALEMYQAGAGSLGYVAEKVGLSKRDLVREARARGIEPAFDEQAVREELGS